MQKKEQTKIPSLISRDKTSTLPQRLSFENKGSLDLIKIITTLYINLYML